MGMFTRVYVDVLEPDMFISRREVQFKTGKDGCEAYEIGGELLYELGPDDPHSDIFEGIGSTYLKQTKEHIFYHYFVVVVNRMIVAVIPSVIENRWLQEQLIRLFYNIEPDLTWEQIVTELQRPHWYNRLWNRFWPWSKRNKDLRRIKKVDWKKFGEEACNPIKAAINYDGLARQIICKINWKSQEKTNSS